MEPMYVSIQQRETGKQIKKMLMQHGYTVKDVQRVMGFENPQAIYKWISGKSLPSIDGDIVRLKERKISGKKEKFVLDFAGNLRRMFSWPA